MIGMLRGTVAGSHGTHILLDVQGVGYRVAVRSVFDFLEGSSATLHTYLAVRENALDLYGFNTQNELQMFEALIKLPKIGPKSAMQILMQADISTLRQAIEMNDPVYLTKTTGIGKKTAEKIVSELKDEFGSFTHDVPSHDMDVIDALLALGYAQKDVRDAILKINPEVTDTRKRITEALKILSS